MTVVLEHLYKQGYEPQDFDHPTAMWFDLIASGTGTVRVCSYPRDDYRVEVFLFDRHMVCEWQVSLSPGTPDLVIVATIEAAERELAAKRGGPVTPAQAAAR